LIQPSDLAQTLDSSRTIIEELRNTPAMKKSLAIFFLIALFVHCKKSNQVVFHTPLAARLISMRGYEAGFAFRADTFIYNNMGYLLTQKEWTYTRNVPDNDTLVVTFNYSDTGKDPNSYTLIDGWGRNTYTLSYDNQGRLLSDTLIPDFTSMSSTFSYPNDKTVAYSSADNASTDTIFLTYSNITKISQASIPFDPIFYAVTFFSYASSYPNAFYYVCQTNNLKILLTKIDGWELFRNDFMSYNFFTTLSDNQGYGFNVTYVTDPVTGRVSTLSTLSDSLSFIYQ
jgi:hypothetical protein